MPQNEVLNEENNKVIISSLISNEDNERYMNCFYIREDNRVYWESYGLELPYNAIKEQVDNMDLNVDIMFNSTFGPVIFLKGTEIPAKKPSRNLNYDVNVEGDNIINTIIDYIPQYIKKHSKSDYYRSYHLKQLFDNDYRTDHKYCFLNKELFEKLHDKFNEKYGDADFELTFESNKHPNVFNAFLAQK